MANVFIYKPIYKKVKSKFKFKKKLNRYEISTKVNTNSLHLYSCTKCIAWPTTFCLCCNLVENVCNPNLTTADPLL